MNTPTESSIKNIGKINDIQVPKSYILKQLHNRYLDKINDYIKEIEQYIEDEIHDTHLTHVTPNIKDHIDILVSKFNLHSMVHPIVVNHVVKILNDIIESSQNKVASKKMHNRKIE